MMNTVKVFKSNNKNPIMLDLDDWLKLPKSCSLFIDSNTYPGFSVYCSEIRREESTSLHRWIMNNPRNMVVDHINGNRLDARKKNLRVCSQQQNCQNRRPLRHKKYKGVHWRSDRSKWETRVGIPNEFYANGRQKVKFIGHFNTEIEAAKAYDVVARQHYGEFAYLNFPENK